LGKLHYIATRHLLASHVRISLFRVVFFLLRVTNHIQYFIYQQWKTPDTLLIYDFSRLKRYIRLYILHM